MAFLVLDKQPIGLLFSTKFSGHYMGRTALRCGGHPEEDKKSFAQGGFYLMEQCVCCDWIDVPTNFTGPGIWVSLLFPIVLATALTA